MIHPPAEKPGGFFTENSLLFPGREYIISEYYIIKEYL